MQANGRSCSAAIDATSAWVPSPPAAASASAPSATAVAHAAAPGRRPGSARWARSPGRGPRRRGRPQAPFPRRTGGSRSPPGVWAAQRAEARPATAKTREANARPATRHATTTRDSRIRPPTEVSTIAATSSAAAGRNERDPAGATAADGRPRGRERRDEERRDDQAARERPHGGQHQHDPAGGQQRERRDRPEAPHVGIVVLSREPRATTPTPARPGNVLTQLRSPSGVNGQRVVFSRPASVVVRLVLGVVVSPPLRRG